MTPEFITEVIRSGGVVGLLILGIWYFLKKEKSCKAIIEAKEEIIEALHTEIKEINKETNKENVMLLFKTAAFMEKGDKNFEDLKNFITREFDSLKNLGNGKQ